MSKLSPKVTPQDSFVVLHHKKNTSMSTNPASPSPGSDLMNKIHLLRGTLKLALHRLELESNVGVSNPRDRVILLCYKTLRETDSELWKKT
jgi:hypothetical protein